MVGLGNDDFSSDALGPETIKRINANSYLEDHNNALASDIVKYSHGPRCTFFDYECPSDCKLGPVKKLDRRV